MWATHELLILLVCIIILAVLLIRGREVLGAWLSAQHPAGGVGEVAVLVLRKELEAFNNKYEAGCETDECMRELGHDVDRLLGKFAAIGVADVAGPLNRADLLELKAISDEYGQSINASVISGSGPGETAQKAANKVRQFGAKVAAVFRRKKPERTFTFHNIPNIHEPVDISIAGFADMIGEFVEHYKQCIDQHSLLASPGQPIDPNAHKAIDTDCTVIMNAYANNDVVYNTSHAARRIHRLAQDIRNICAAYDKQNPNDRDPEAMSGKVCAKVEAIAAFHDMLLRQDPEEKHSMTAEEKADAFVDEWMQAINTGDYCNRLIQMIRHLIAFIEQGHANNIGDVQGVIQTMTEKGRAIIAACPGDEYRALVDKMLRLLREIHLNPSGSHRDAIRLAKLQLDQPITGHPSIVERERAANIALAEAEARGTKSNTPIEFGEFKGPTEVALDEQQRRANIWRQFGPKWTQYSTLAAEFARRYPDARPKPSFTSTEPLYKHIEGNMVNISFEFDRAMDQLNEEVDTGTAIINRVMAKEAGRLAEEERKHDNPSDAPTSPKPRPMLSPRVMRSPGQIAQSSPVLPPSPPSRSSSPGLIRIPSPPLGTSYVTMFGPRPAEEEMKHAEQAQLQPQPQSFDYPPIQWFSNANTGPEELGYRGAMEDAHVDSAGPNGWQLYAVFDGHGTELAGDQTAMTKLLAKKLPKYIWDRLTNVDTADVTNIKDAIKAGFADMHADPEFKGMAAAANVPDSHDTTGSTCVMLLRHDRDFYTANLGDSRCFIVVGDTIRAETTDHNYSDVVERARMDPAKCVATKDPKYFKRRDEPANSTAHMEPTRGFGDYEYEGCLNRVPDVDHIVLTEDDMKEDAYAVIACDGLFDIRNDDRRANPGTPYLTTQAVINFINCVEHEPDDMAKALGFWAMKARDYGHPKDSTDNITIGYLPINKGRRAPCAKGPMPLPLPTTRMQQAAQIAHPPAPQVPAPIAARPIALLPFAQRTPPEAGRPLLDPYSETSVRNFRKRWRDTATSIVLADLMSAFPGPEMLAGHPDPAADPILFIKRYMAEQLRHANLPGRPSPLTYWNNVNNRRAFFAKQLAADANYYIRATDYYKAADQVMPYVPITPPTLIAAAIDKFRPERILDVSLSWGSGLVAAAIASHKSAHLTGLNQNGALGRGLEAMAGPRATIMAGSIDSVALGDAMHDLVIVDVGTGAANPTWPKIRKALTKGGHIMLILHVGNPQASIILGAAKATGFTSRDAQTVGQFSATYLTASA